MTDSLSQSPASGITVHLRGRLSAAIVLCVLAIPLALLAVHSEELDFRAFHVAAKATAAHLDPYADNRQYGGQFVDVANENGISRWIYPPSGLFFVRPLGFFSFKAAKILFELLSIASLIGTLLFLGSRFRVSPIWLAFACISLPVIACVQRGQVDLLILLCVVLAYRFSGKFWAGIPLGIAISIKIFPAALLLWWLLEKKFKQAAIAIAFTFAISLLAAWRFGLSSYTSFLHNLTTLHSQTSTGGTSASWPGHFALPHLAGPWLSVSPGFVGSYNNPLILLGNGGILLGFVFTVAAAFLLRFRRVAPEVGFYSMVLISQMMNTALWTMGMVMYIPICLVAIGRLRSYGAAILWLVPLYIPSQIRVFGVTPRFVVALLLVVWIASWNRPEDGTPCDGSSLTEHNALSEGNPSVYNLLGSLVLATGIEWPRRPA